MNSEDTVAVRLSLRNRTGFVRDAELSAKAVDDIGDQARQSSASLRAMSMAGVGAKRVGFAAIRYGAYAAAAGVAALGYGVYKGAKSLARIERIGAQTNAVIESTGGAANVTRKHVDALAESLENSTATEAETITEGANMLLTFKSIQNQAGAGNDIFDQSVGILNDMGRAMGNVKGAMGDLKKPAILIGKALQDPIKGATALRRVGVEIPKALQEMIEEADRRGVAAFEGSELVKAQKILLKELNAEFGGSGEAFAQTFEGQWELFKHRLGTAFEGVAKVAMPILEDILAEVGPILIDIVNTLGPPFAQIVDVIGDLLGPLLKNLTPFGKILGDIFVNIGTALLPVLEMLGPILTRTLRALLPALNPLVSALGEGLVVILESIGPILPDVAKSVADLVIALVPLIPLAAALIGFVLKLGGPVIQAVAGAISGVAGPLGDLLGSVAEGAVTVINFLLKGVNWLIDQINKIDIDLPGGAFDVSFDLHHVSLLPTESSRNVNLAGGVSTLHSGGRTTSGGAVNIRPGEELVVLPPAANVIPLPLQEDRILKEAVGGWPERIAIEVDRRVLAELTLDDVRDRKARR